MIKELGLGLGAGAISLGSLAIFGTGMTVGQMIPLIVALLGAISWGIIRLWRFIQRVNQLEDTVYGNERDDLQQGTVAELTETKQSVERIEEMIDDELDNED